MSENKEYISDDDLLDIEMSRKEDIEYRKMLEKNREKVIPIGTELYFKKLSRLDVTEQELKNMFVSEGDFNFSDSRKNNSLMVILGRYANHYPHLKREPDNDIRTILDCVLSMQNKFKSTVNLDGLCLLSLTVLSGYYDVAEHLYKKNKVKFSKKCHHRSKQKIVEYANIGLLKQYVKLGSKFSKEDIVDMYKWILNGESKGSSASFVDYLIKEYDLDSAMVVTSDMEEARYNTIYAGASPLMRAAQSLQIDLIDYFLENGNSNYDVDKLGMNALSYAIHSKRKVSSEEYLAVIKKLVTSADLILRNGAKPYKQVCSRYFGDINDMAPIREYFEEVLKSENVPFPE